MASGGKRGGGSERLLESRHLVGLFLAVVLLCCVFFTLGYVMGKSQGAAGLRASLAADDTEAASAPAPLNPSAGAPGAGRQGSGQAGSSAAGSQPDSGEWDFSGAKKNPSSPAAAPAPAASVAAPPVTTTPVNSPSASAAPPAGKPASSPAAPPKPAARNVASGAASSAPSAAPSAPAGSKYSPPRIPRGAVILQVAALTKRDDALAMAEALQKKNFPAFVLTPTSDNYFRVQVGPYADKKSAATAKQGLEAAGFKPIIKK